MTDNLQPFEADVSRVLDIVINSLYQHREIFLRELISNASDACDRLRYASLSQPELLGEDPDLGITVSADPEAGTLTIADNGIGMDHDDLVQNLGTVARSGTARFLEQASGDARQDLGLIGQFGVGFYSAFMVADRVAVITRKAGEETSWRWVSDGRSGYAITETDALAPRGTAVVLHLKDDAEEFLEGARLRHVIRTYSDHIAIPITLRLPVKTADSRPADGEAIDRGTDGAAEPASEQVNTASALWQRPRGEIGDEQYREFYHHVAHAFDDPFARVHFKVEGRLSYTGLLFVPGMRPFDLYDPKRTHGVKLYVRRVFISDRVDGLLPRYLRFVAGVVDSEDLQLNVSRETLQHNAVVVQMRKAITKRVIDELARLAKTEGDEARKAYEGFWENFGAVVKEGLYEDSENRARLLELARFRTTRDEDAWVTLADYVGRMKPGQDAILAISGDHLAALRSSPLLEACRAKDVEVLLLDDPVDDFWLQSVDGFEGKPFRSLSKGELDLSAIEAAAKDGAATPENDEPEESRPAPDLSRLIMVMKARLGEAVGDVRASKRLTESAVCLVADEHGLDLHLERFLRQHQQIDQLGRRILEINPDHGLIRRMAEMAEGEGGEDAVGELALLLLDQARIVEGEPLPDPGAFSRRLSAALARGLAG